MNLVSSKVSKVFLCKDTKINILDKVDIILSPEFYWVRIFDIPVKSVGQAKYVLPTLFEDILQNIKELSYQIIKLEDGKFLCFAYENKKIFDAIKNSGINLSLVSSVYFAQNECTDIKQFIAEDKAFSYTNDGILVKIPKTLLTDNINISEKIDKINLSSNKVGIKLYNNLLSTKQIYLISIICFFFVIINLFKILSYNEEITKIDNKIKKVKSSVNMPSSILQVNSIINSHKKSVKKEILKRKAIVYVLSNRNFKLNSFELKKDILSLYFKNADKKKLEDYLSSKYEIISSKSTDLNLNIRIKI